MPDKKKDISFWRKLVGTTPYLERPTMFEWLRQQHAEKIMGIPVADQKAFDAYQRSGGKMNINAWRGSGKPKADQAITPAARRGLTEKKYPFPRELAGAPVEPPGREEFMAATRQAQAVQEALKREQQERLPPPVDPIEALRRELAKAQQYQQIPAPPAGATPEEQAIFAPPRGEPSIIDLARQMGYEAVWTGDAWQIKSLEKPPKAPPITEYEKGMIGVREREAGLAERTQTFAEEEARRTRQAQEEEARRGRQAQFEQQRLAAETAWRQRGLERNQAEAAMREQTRQMSVAANLARATQREQGQQESAARNKAEAQALYARMRGEVSPQDELQRLALAQREAESLRNYELARQGQLASLRAQPASWLEYASLAGTTPAVQPWMVPLLGGGGNVPSQYGGPLPGWSPQGPLTQLEPLLTPSMQYWQQRMSPAEQQQYGGYEQARTGTTPASSQWKIWQMAPPRGR